MFIDKKGVKCRNEQEQVAKNQEDIADIYEDIEDIYAQLSLINAAYIEIDDTELIGQGDLTDEQVEKLSNYEFVYVVLTRDKDVHLAFGGEKYEEQNQIIKSLAAGGYARVISFDLDAKTWQYYESDEDITALVQRIEYLEKNKEDVAEFVEISSETGTLTEEELTTLEASKRNFIIYNGTTILRNEYEDDKGIVYSAHDSVNTFEVAIIKANREYEFTIERLATLTELNAKQDAVAYIDIEDSSGTLTQEQIDILSASELNYIWYNNTFRLDFKYRNYNEGISIYSARKENECAAVFVNLQTGTYIAYELTLEKQMTGGTNVSIDRNHSDSPIINVPEAAVSVLTTAPTSRYIDGGAKIVHLASSEGVQEYDGYIYMYDED